MQRTSLAAVPSPTIADALEVATVAWSGAGAKVMASMAGRCVTVLGGDTPMAALEARHGFTLLRILSERGLSAKSVQSYYSAFRRAMALGGLETPGWPTPPAPPKRAAMDDPGVLAETISALEANGWSDTADLIRLIRGTGLRVQVEALAGAFKVSLGDAYDTLSVGSEERGWRTVPVVDPEARALLREPERLAALEGVTYSGHLKRWRKANGRGSLRMARTAFAETTLEATGGNAALVRNLLG